MSIPLPHIFPFHSSIHEIYKYIDDYTETLTTSTTSTSATCFFTVCCETIHEGPACTFYLLYILTSRLYCSVVIVLSAMNLFNVSTAHADVCMSTPFSQHISKDVTDSSKRRFSADFFSDNSNEYTLYLDNIMF